MRLNESGNEGNVATKEREAIAEQWKEDGGGERVERKDREKKEKTEKIGCFVTGVCTIRLRCRVKRINVLTHTESRDNVYHGPLDERKKMRKLSYFVQPPFLFASVFHSRAPRPREHRGEPGHARSSAGYYFSRRIFPQMNFMKTVFALLINRCSVAGPSPKPPSVPISLLAWSPPLLRRVHYSFHHSVDSRGSPDRAKLLIIILFQGPREDRDAYVLPF